MNAAVQRKPALWRTLLMFLSIVGPGIITANADNDVGGITTYSLAGAQFGYSLLWLLIPVTIALVVTQEMCARMGAVTGKGLADLIRENFGVKVTFWVLLTFVLGDLGNTAAEFAGIASAAPILQQYAPLASQYVLVPLAAAFVFMTVTRGSYKIVERIFFVFCAVYLSYVISGIIVHPPWKEVLTQTVVPHIEPTKAYLIMAIGVIGTTISPWMQFYIQAAVVDKGVRVKDYPYSRLDVISGAIFTDVIAFFIIVASAATIFAHNLHAAQPLQINDAGDVASALAPLAGKYASLLFAVGLLNAAIFTASVDRVLRLRGLRVRTRRRTPFPGRPHLLRAVSRANRHRRRLRAHSGCAAARRYLLFTGRQRHAIAGDPHLNAAANQPQETHGNVRERSRLQWDRVDDRHRRGSANDSLYHRDARPRRLELTTPILLSRHHTNKTESFRQPPTSIECYEP